MKCSKSPHPVRLPTSSLCLFHNFFDNDTASPMLEVNEYWKQRPMEINYLLSQSINQSVDNSVMKRISPTASQLGNCVNQSIRKSLKSVIQSVSQIINKTRDTSRPVIQSVSQFIRKSFRSVSLSASHSSQSVHQQVTSNQSNYQSVNWFEIYRWEGIWYIIDATAAPPPTPLQLLTTATPAGYS